MMRKNPFDHEEPPSGPRTPFGDETPEDPVSAMEHAAARIRRLKSQVGAEGLTLAGTRDLLDQVSTALEAAARALRKLGP
jgi:hypothetical protein